MKIDDAPPSTAESFAKGVKQFGFAETLPAYDIPDKDIIARHDDHFIWISFPDGSSISRYQGNIITMTCIKERLLIATACADHRMMEMEDKLNKLADKVNSQLHPDDELCPEK